MSETQTAIEATSKPVAKSRIDYSKGLPPVALNPVWCKACNICISLCPNGVLEADQEGKPLIAKAESCTQCGICWTHCPDSALTSNYK